MARSFARPIIASAIAPPETRKTKTRSKIAMPTAAAAFERYHTAREIGQYAAQPRVASHALGVALLAHLDPMSAFAFAAVEAEVTQWLDPIASWVEDLALAVIVGRLRCWLMIVPRDNEPDANLHLEKQRAERCLARNDVVASGSCSALSFGSSRLRRLCYDSKVWPSPNVPWRRLEFRQ
jgi:hypothetical protein